MASCRRTAGFLVVLMLCACGPQPDDGDAGTAPAPSASNAGSPTASPSVLSAATAVPTVLTFAARTGELVNPDNQTMVFLYYDIAGLAPPVERWIEADRDVRYGDAGDKPARRVALREGFTAAQASVRNVGLLRLTVESNLSDYDPSYGEFIVQALSPSSTFSFSALSQRVTLRLANGQQAQRWTVTPGDAQAIKDRVRYLPGTELDVLLRITGVQPGVDGGSLTVEVVSYEIRDRGAGVLGRVMVAE